jgi:hypothetical protein
MRQIFVDSRDRSSGTSTNFQIPLPQTLSLSQGHQGRIDDLRIPNALPTISVANNTLQVWINGGYKTATMTNGNCNSGEELKNRILEALTRDVTGFWDVKYDATQMTLEIIGGNDFAFAEGGTYSKQLLSRPYTRSSLKQYLFLYVPLLGLDVCYLCCPNFSNMDNVSPKHSSDVLCAIPFDVPYGATQLYSMSSSVFFDIPACMLQQLSFQLRDRDFNIVNSVANISFTLTID